MNEPVNITVNKPLVRKPLLRPSGRVAGKYIVTKYLGKGSFGEIFEARDLYGSAVAVKAEPYETETPHLYYEYKVYQVIGTGPGIPKILHYGNDRKVYALVMQHLGPSLEDYFNFCQRRFSMRTVLLLFDQMLQRVKFVHSKGIIHRDIKPENFLMGNRRESNTVYLIDFGLASKYRDVHTKVHIPFREDKGLVGTARYASLNNHMGIEQSRRDDLESLGYVIIYLLKGSLPWQGITAKNKAQLYEKIFEKKFSTLPPVLCRGLPMDFAAYIDECRCLKFDANPNYNGYIRRFRTLFHNYFHKCTSDFDWIILVRNIGPPDKQNENEIEEREFGSFVNESNRSNK